MDQELGIALSFVTTGLGTENDLQVIGLGRKDHLPYLTFQDSQGGWHDSGPLLKDYLTPWSMLAIGSDFNKNPLVIGLGLDDNLPYLINQDSKGGWHDSGRLVKSNTRRWLTLAIGKGSSNLPQVIGLGRKDGLLYLIDQDKMGTWHNEGLLLKDYARPWSTLVIAKNSSNLLQVIGLGRNDGLPYVISQDSAGGWHDAGRLVKTNNMPWSTLATGISSSNTLQVIGLGRSDGLPYWFWQDDKGIWSDAGRLLKKDNHPWAALTVARGPRNLLGVIGLGQDNRLPYAVSQDEKGNWNEASLQPLKFTDLAFDVLAAGAGSANTLQVIGTGHDDGLPYRIWQDSSGWHFGGLLPLGEKQLDRGLQPGEALVFSENNYQGRQRLITGDTANIERYFPIASIQLGSGTGATLFSESHFMGTSQELFCELASFTVSRLQQHTPQALKLWPISTRSFTGYWAIQLTKFSGEHYLSVQAGIDGLDALTTDTQVTDRESIHIKETGQVGSGYKAVEFVARGDRGGPPLRMVDEADSGPRNFSLQTQDGQWIRYDSMQNRFVTSTDPKDRAIFCLSIKIAEDETQVGALEQGEVALFEKPGYWGKAWVFSADCPDFSRIANLDNAVSSIQLGPLAGATIYREAKFTAVDEKLGKQDVTKNLASLAEEEVDDNRISSIELWKIVQPAIAGISIQSHLSQDFRGTNNPVAQGQGGAGEKKDGKFAEYSAYRTTIRFPYAVTSVDIWATDETQIEVNNRTYPVGEDQPVTLQPNPMKTLMITTDACVFADGQAPRASLRAPGLKIRTNTMRPHERIVIYPDQEVHGKLANLKGTDLWDAKIKDKDGSEHDLVDKKDDQQKSDITQAQNMIAATMSTVKYDTVASGGWSQEVSPTDNMQNKGWMLDFPSYRVTADNLRVRTGPGTTFEQIDLLKYNEVVRILQFNSDQSWIRIVRSNGQIGWSSARFLDQIVANPLPPGTQYRTRGSYVLIREMPGTQYAQIGSVPPKTTVTSLGMDSTNTWVKIHFNDKEGWSSAGELTLVPPATKAPVADQVKGMPEAQEFSALGQAQPPALPPLIRESDMKFREISYAEVLALHAQAITRDTDLAQGWFLDDIANAVKNAVSVVVAQVEKGVELIVQFAGQVIRWVADTAQKVVAFVEGVFEKIGLAINDVINWLRYVFDWQDILDAKNYLHGLVTEKMGLVCQPLLKQASEQTASFFKNKKHVILDVFDNAIRSMGGDPTRNKSTEGSNFVGQIASSFESSGISDAIDWIFAKVTGAGMGSGDPAFAAAGSEQQSLSERDEEIRRFFDNSLVNGLGNLVSMPGDIGEIVTVLVRNPDNPLLAVARLLQMIRDQVAGLLDVGENLVLGLLKYASDLIDKFIQLLDTAIRIPFLSDILEWLGLSVEKVSFLDAASFILAVPITILSKALFHAAPFAGLKKTGQAWEVPPAWFWLLLTSSLSSAFDSLVGTSLDCMTDKEKQDAQGNIDRRGVDLEFDYIAECIGLTFAWLGWFFGLLADAVEKEDTEHPLPDRDERLADWILPGYDFLLLITDTCLLSYGSDKQTRTRLRRYDKQKSLIASILGLLHVSLFIWNDFDCFDGLTVSDTLTTLPDVTAFLLAKEPVPTNLVFLIGMGAMMSSLYPPVFRLLQFEQVI